MADNWQPFPLPDGSYSDDTRPWSAQDIVNYLPVKAEQGGTLSTHKLRTAPGLKRFAYLGTKPVRGMHDVEGKLYVVAGDSLYRVFPDGDSDNLGPIPGTGRVQMVHNQVAGGNQLVIATRTNGTWVYADEGAEVASGNPGGSPGGDSDGEGGSGGGSSQITIDKLPASTSLGPNGGYPDDAEPEIPLPSPEMIGVELITDGTFTGGTLTGWDERPNDGTPGEWSVVSGKAQYAGTYGGELTYGDAIYSLPLMPLPRYTVAISANVQTTGGATASIGMLVTGGGSSYYMSTPAEYATETLVSYSFEWVQTTKAVSIDGYRNAVPILRVDADEPPAASTVTFDDVTVEITEIATPVTEEVITNSDFSAGSAGWTEQTVTPNGPVFGTGMVSYTGFDPFNNVCRIVNADAIATADTDGKYVKITYEVWCNDPSANNGAAVGLKIDPGFDYYGYQRGDWTTRVVWFRHVGAYAAPQLALFFRVGVGYTAKIRNIVVEVTDSAVD